jgi:hypothetical protein
MNYKTSATMKRFLALIFCAFLSLSIQAQTGIFAMHPESPSVIARISLITPKLIAEIAPTDFFTLTAGFWLHTSLWTENEYDQRIYNPTFSPSFTFEPRYYFNLAERQQKGKRTDYFSGWFIAMPFSIRFPDLRYALGGTIGFQCTMGKRWYWNFSIGPGFNYYDSRFHFEGAGDVGLGIILNRM